ncbi:MAG: hypothetical protein AB1420_04010 [Bacillota bacterium]
MKVLGLVGSPRKGFNTDYGDMAAQTKLFIDRCYRFIEMGIMVTIP